jgi:hypothetical protein
MIDISCSPNFGGTSALSHGFIGNGAYDPTVAHLSIRYRMVKYLNNIIEADHGKLKPLKSMRTTYPTQQGRMSVPIFGISATLSCGYAASRADLCPRTSGSGAIGKVPMQNCPAHDVQTAGSDQPAQTEASHGVTVVMSPP